jgi:hypothetical protein
LNPLESYPAVAKRILVIAHDLLLQRSRSAMLRRWGYEVVTADSDNEGIALTEVEKFDLVLLGRKSVIPRTGADERLRERHPDLLILKIVPDGEYSAYPSRLTGPNPIEVYEALIEMLGGDVALKPVLLRQSAATVGASQPVAESRGSAEVGRTVLYPAALSQSVIPQATSSTELPADHDVE